MKINNKVKVARDFATIMHDDAGQSYDGMAYSTHLWKVVALLEHWGCVDEDVLAAGYLHDVLEDTCCSGTAIQDIFGTKVWQLVDAVTDEPGPNRKARKAATYPKIRALPEAVLIKLADRCANVSSCRVSSNEGLLKMYRKEQPDFAAALRRGAEFQPQWEWLEAMLAPGAP